MNGKQLTPTTIKTIKQDVMFSMLQIILKQEPFILMMQKETLLRKLLMMIKMKKKIIILTPTMIKIY